MMHTRWFFCAVAALLIGSARTAVCADPAPPPPAGWRSEVNGGLGLNAGNSKTLNWHVGAATQIKTNATEFSLKGEYKYGKSTTTDQEGEEVQDTTEKNATGDTQFNHLLSPRTYALVKATALYDAIAAIDYRFIGGPGLGWYAFKETDRLLSLEAGVAYLTEKVDAVRDDAAVYRLAQRVERTYDAGSKIWQSVEYLPQISDVYIYLVNAEVGAEAMLNGNLSLRAVLLDRYDSAPADGRDRNDLSVNAGLVCKF